MGNIKVKIGKTKQNRHENLVIMLSLYPQFFSLQIHKKTRTAENCENFLKVEEISQAVNVFTDVLNISETATENMNLYSLLEKYLLNKEKREKINSVLNEETSIKKNYSLPFFESYKRMKSETEKRTLRNSIIKKCKIQHSTFYSWLHRKKIPPLAQKAISDIMKVERVILFPET